MCISQHASCTLTLKNRSSCQYCRYQKCLSVGMDLALRSQHLTSSECITACVICTAPSSGIHFGVTTCEACKGFFRRSFVDKAMCQPKKYKCQQIGLSPTTGRCLIDSKTRVCRYCRFQKCLSVEMSIGCEFFTHFV